MLIIEFVIIRLCALLVGNFLFGVGGGFCGFALGLSLRNCVKSTNGINRSDDCKNDSDAGNYFDPVFDHRPSKPR